MNGVANTYTSSFIPKVNRVMLNIGKKMLCVYGVKPNHSTNEQLSWRENMSENLLGESRKKVTVRIRLFPRESQPSSSTRWWTVTLKGKSAFRRNKHNVKIIEKVGTKTFTTSEGTFSFDDEFVVVRGMLEDDSVSGQYFLLRLKHPERGETCSTDEAEVLYEGTLARSKNSCGGDDTSWEVTHDAVVFREQNGVC